MKNVSIRAKIVLAAIVATLLGGALVLLFVQRGYQESVDLIAVKSIANAQQSYDTILQGDTDKLSIAIDVIMADENIRETYLEALETGDRDELYATNEELFLQMRESYGLTHWYFVRPEPDLRVFLRMHSRDEYDNLITRKTFNDVVDTKDYSADIEFGSRMTYSLHVAHPYYDNNGDLIGYINLGEETDHFFDNMKEHTGDDYWLLVSKEGVDQEKWISRREKQEREDTWDFAEDLLLITWTGEDKSPAEWDGDPADLPIEGEVIDQVTKGDNVYIRGVFPVTDVQGQQSGAVIVMHDITDVYDGMRTSQTQIVAAVGAMVVLIPLVLFLILNTTLVKRLDDMLERVNDTQTRVAGGDFDYKPREVTSGDEIGRFEKTFEQFMVMVTGLLKEKID